MEVFIPFNEAMVEKFGFDIGRLVPFQIEYRCFHAEDGPQTQPDVEVVLEETA